MYKKLLFVGVFVFIFNLTYSQSQTILDVPGLGKVEADLAKMELVFTCYNPWKVPIEYSILAGSTYTQSEAGGWAAADLKAPVKREKLPHYVTFIVTIARYEKMGVAICRENDKKIACKVIN